MRGELDNRTRGRVHGHVWLHGWTEPVRLQLEGNSCPDLAGCLLTFENPEATIPLPPDARFSAVQEGRAGDLTASRKVRVPTVPVEEFYRLRKAGLPAPEHIANGLYLEWYSRANGRVVIESHTFRLKVSTPNWRLSPAEEDQRQEAAAEGFASFLGGLNQALEAARHEPPEDKELDEFDYEKLLRESDVRTEKYMELLDKYQDHPDRERIIAQEMGWEELGAAPGLADLDDAPPVPADPPGPADADEAADADEKDEEPNEDLELPEPDPTTEGVDWVRDEEGRTSHPLSLRAFNSGLALWRRCNQLGLDRSSDVDLARMVTEFQITGAKLAGALDGLAYGRELREGGFVVAALKRALSHLHAAQDGLEALAPKGLLPSADVQSTRQELFGIREEILRLMQEFRGRT